ncbi:MAG: hypothetical protein JWR61_1615 [Ferruginibacter sp.]|uniref:PepSY-like domain-containing protein n=1 Tax=Ferruginibacter sp. TaxID=1940288 RepID=UPI002658EDC8|nr:PepSY-like domain-containing protein [Ferruginibacter sp.]MDB5276660.1 hypothetical protein [Ferruginibacter sp.]
MKISNVKNSLIAGLVLFVLGSCKKENSLTGTTANTTTVSQSVVASVQAIAVGTTSSRITGTDSLYVIGTCAVHHHTDSVAFSSLPSTITDYLTANYSGYTAQKAFTDKDSTGSISGYVVIIEYNGKPVGLKFDATGTFVKVLEQREGHDLVGHGWHEGGHFDDRGGMKHDSIAIPSLPSAIISYFAANYAQDTLMHAFKNNDSSIVVLSINNGVYATLFDASGVFIQRTQLPSHHGDFNTIAQSALPSAIADYLATTYPNYVFKQAFLVNDSSGLKGYVVFIDANATKYAVEFDASGTFVKAVTVR